MKIEIDGNPGTGNTFTEIHIGQVQNYNPAATTVVNNYYGEGSSPVGTSQSEVLATPAPSAKLSQSDIDTRPIHAEILRYVSKVRPLLADEHKAGFPNLWTDILAIPEVAAEVYNPGKQQHTTFNRNLVAGIIGMMKNEGIITETNVTRLTELLEGDKEHSVRNAIANPPSRVIINKVCARIEALKTSF